MNAIAEIYGRVPPLIRAMPLVLLIPAAAELAQHVAEIGLGMYAPDGLAAAGSAPLRMAFGAVKVLAIFLTVLFAVRYWAFGDAKRALRPTRLLFKGLALYIAVEIGGELILMLIGRGLGLLVGEGASRGARLALVFAPLLLVLFFINLLLPWFVGMIVEDRTMTARRSIAAIRGRLWATFGILLAGFVPLMIVHYAFGYGAIDRPPAIVWALMIVDAGVVGVLAVVLASTYYTIYRRAAARAQVA